MFHDFSALQIALTAVAFLWTGFVRSGLGFGGAALGLPLLLFIDNRPLLWLPVIGAHLLFFSGLTLTRRLNDVDWGYLRGSARYILPAAVVGVFGLVSLPTHVLNLFIYSVSLFYGTTWLFGWTIASRQGWVDKLLLIAGGYVAGTSLTGAPLMVAVYMRHVPRELLRNTLFVLWFILVALKMTTFALLCVDLQIATTLALLPAATVGHVIGLRVHEAVLRNDALFKRIIGGGLVVVSALGMMKLG